MQTINLSVLNKLNTTIVLTQKPNIEQFYAIEFYYDKYGDTDFFQPLSSREMFEYDNPKFLYDECEIWEYTLADLAEKYLEKDNEWTDLEEQTYWGMGANEYCQPKYRQYPLNEQYFFDADEIPF